MLFEVFKFINMLSPNISCCSDCRETMNSCPIPGVWTDPFSFSFPMHPAIVYFASLVI